MRFFKYLIFTFLFFISSAHAGYYIQHNKDVTLRETKAQACSAYAAHLNKIMTSNGQYSYTVNFNTPFCQIKRSDGGLLNGSYLEAPIECWYPDYKIVSQDVNNEKIKKSICLNVNGALCKYTGDTKNVQAINGYITTVFSSVSKTPDPNCQEELANPPCDPKDPYGGCFMPADDGCTRQFDGSILCPDEVEPPIEQGCNGADYCKRPPRAAVKAMFQALSTVSVSV